MSTVPAHTTALLTDTYGRRHSYLRISLTEKCNLRCTYCMPEEGVTLLPQRQLMTSEEILDIASTFVSLGVKKIRLTGGEPMVRKDFPEILRRLQQLPVALAITTNGILIPKYLPVLLDSPIRTITISLDTLQADKYQEITRRDQYHQVWNAIRLLQENNFHVKLNCVLIKGYNDDEIINFIELTREQNITVRFIEFMPFDGNQWNREKTVSEGEVLTLAQTYFGFLSRNIHRLQDAPNDTSRNYKIQGYQGSFAIISTVTNPFCDTCNRIRLTADGKIKNCLFSNTEYDLLTPIRSGKDTYEVIRTAIQTKEQARGGLDAQADFENPQLHDNRSMIRIGG